MFVWAMFMRATGHIEIIKTEEQLAWRGHLDGQLIAGGSQDVIIYKIDEYDTDNPYQAGDPLADVRVVAYDYFLPSGQKLPDDTEVAVTWFADDGRFYVTSAKC